MALTGCAAAAPHAQASNTLPAKGSPHVDLHHYDADLRLLYVNPANHRFTPSDAAETSAPTTPDEDLVEGVVLMIYGDVRVHGELQDANTVVLDAVGFRIEDVKIQAQLSDPSEGPAPAATWTYENHKLQLIWDAPFTGTFTAAIAYAVAPTKGIHISEREPEKPTIWTAFHTWHWLPTTIDPSERATLALNVEVPDGWTVLATGDGPNAPGPDVASKVPHPSYVYGFAAGFLGPHHKRDGLQTWGANESQSALVFDRTEAAIERWNQQFGDGHWPAAFEGDATEPSNGSPLYTQLFVYGGRGQELAGMSILPLRTLETLAENPDEDWLIVHELAHQIWGNFVTCRTWGDFWLNEAIVVWWVGRDKQLRGDQEGYERELGLWVKRREKAWTKALTHGGDGRIARPDVDVEGAGGSLVYHGGALTVAFIADLIGVETFEAELAHWMSGVGTGGGSVSTTDFVEHLPVPQESRDQIHRMLDGQE